MENGWIKLHRKITEWEWFTDSKTLHVFLYLLMNANRNPRKWRGKMIDAGQIATGRKSISSATGISEQSVRTALSNLTSTNEITSEPTNRFTIITICNYSKYQMLECYGNQPTNQQLTSNQPATNHKQEVKKVKKERIEPKNNGRFSPPEIHQVQEYCNERKNNVDPQRFIDFYSSKGWMVGKNKMKDWRAAVRTWESSGKSEQEEDRFEYAARQPTFEEKMLGVKNGQ